jgi:hypothetical protein
MKDSNTTTENDTFAESTVTPTTITKKNTELTQAEKTMINAHRTKEFAPSEVKDFDRDYEPETIWFFVHVDGETVSFAGLRPIALTYMGETYHILGICSVISIVKGRRYGTTLMTAITDHAKKTRKTAIGFTLQTEFFRKAGLGTQKGFIKRFIYRNPATGEEAIDEEGDGIYVEGEDCLIEKMLKTRENACIGVPYW